MASTQTSLLDEDIRQLETEIAALEEELAGLENGVHHMRLDNGMTLEVGVTGDELQIDEAAIRAALGVDKPATGADQPAPLQRYLPYALLGGGGLLLVVIGLALRLLLAPQPAATVKIEATPTITATPTMTPTITPTPTATPTPTPPLIPADFIGRAPAEMQVSSLRFKQPVYKGDWTIAGGQVTLNDAGGQARYYDSFVGEDNTVIGGDASTPEAALYPLRSADVNDVVLVTDRAGRKFYFRLLPFSDDRERVERYIKPDEIWVTLPTDRPALTIILRVEGDRRLALRGVLYQTDLGD
ncbi:MAG: hypothetical protein FOGNACKC_05485 [Anaerolineae bacterium]|nr:hypothetical protein [Anaerolineae bacterium]